jgi:hypothetical protein
LFGGTNASIGYPDYSKKDIDEMFGYAWKRWNRHIVLHQPETIYHHLYGVWRREGLKRTCEIVGLGMKNVILG